MTTPETPIEPEWAWALEDDEHAHGPFQSREAAIADALQELGGDNAAGRQILVSRIWWATIQNYLPTAVGLASIMDEEAQGGDFIHWDDEIFSVKEGLEAEATLVLEAWAEKYLEASDVWIMADPTETVTL